MPRIDFRSHHRTDVNYTPFEADLVAALCQQGLSSNALHRRPSSTGADCLLFSNISCFHVNNTVLRMITGQDIYTYD